jgi:hypothetical protein
MNLREAAQMALMVLDNVADETFSPYNDPIGETILALRAALEQSEWQGLTDKEIAATANSLGFYGVRSKDFARLIEAKLKERNVFLWD